jgi:hypothetical protein
VLGDVEGRGYSGGWGCGVRRLTYIIINAFSEVFNILTCWKIDRLFLNCERKGEREKGRKGEREKERKREERKRKRERETEKERQRERDLRPIRPTIEDIFRGSYKRKSEDLPQTTT